ncbi:hypothetical protein NKH77_28660 [Streptomyces sp. M19]
MTVQIDDHRLVPAASPGYITPVTAASVADGSVAEESVSEESVAEEPATEPPRDRARNGHRARHLRSRRRRDHHRGHHVPAALRFQHGAAERRAPPWVRARIRYAEESVAFEKRLAEYLAENETIRAEFRKMASAAWEKARRLHPRQLAAFGDISPAKAGAVGTTRQAFQQVLRNGNLRELVGFLYEGSPTTSCRTCWAAVSRSTRRSRRSGRTVGSWRPGSSTGGAARRSWRRT